jgi:hypothetical protein
MRKLSLTALAALGAAGTAGAQSVTISHSVSSTTITPGNSVACAATQQGPPVTQQTTANALWRSYTLSQFPQITGAFNVTEVTFGVEFASHPNQTQDAKVTLYRDTNGGAPVAVGTDLVQVAQTTVPVPNGPAQFITAPITGAFQQTDVLVVSVATPDYTAQYGPPANPVQTAVFFIGSNNLGETGPSYLSATACGIANPTPTGQLGLPNLLMHIILDVTGNVGGTCYPDCNGDGTLNLADFGCFQTRFATGNMYADCNGDGVLNLADFGCFQTKFALGC